MKLGCASDFMLSFVTMYRHLTFCCTNAVNPVSLQKISLDLLQKSAGFPPVIFTGSIQLRACRDMGVNHQKMKFFVFAVLLVVHSGEKHSAGVDAHHLSRREIGDGDQGLSDQLFRLIISVNSRKNDAVSAGSIVQDELQKLLGLRNS